MFKSDRSTISLSIDDNNSKPFWTTGDVVSGSVRLIVDTRINLSGIDVSLKCKEVAIATNEERDRERNTKRAARIARTTKREITHLHLKHSVLVNPTGGGSMTMDQGEYLFPFTIRIEEEADLCPQYCPVSSRAGYEVGVRWKIQAVARKVKMLQSDLKTDRPIPIFPKMKDYFVPANQPRLIELSGMDYVPKGGLFNFDKSRDKNLGKLFVQLTFADAHLPQRPVPISFHLNVDSGTEVAEIHSVSINLLRKCGVNARGKTDVYTTVHNLGSATVTRRFIGKADLSPLLTGFTLPEILSSGFKSQLIDLKYEIQLVLEYIMPELPSQKKKPRLRKIEISTPVNVVPPWKQWVGRSVHGGGRQVQFDEAAGNEPMDGRRSIMTGRSGNTTTTGTTHSTGYSMTSSVGTVNSYEITRPRDAINSWVTKWTNG